MESFGTKGTAQTQTAAETPALDSNLSRRVIDLKHTAFNQDELHQEVKIQCHSMVKVLRLRGALKTERIRHEADSGRLRDIESYVQRALGQQRSWFDEELARSIGQLCPNLLSLTLSHIELGYRNLAELPRSLRELKLMSCFIDSNTGPVPLSNSQLLSHVKTLEFHNNLNFTSEDVVGWLLYRPSVTKLVLNGLHNVRFGEICRHSEALQNVTVLELTGWSSKPDVTGRPTWYASPEDMYGLLQSCPHIADLHMGMCKSVPIEAMAEIASALSTRTRIYYDGKLANDLLIDDD